MDGIARKATSIEKRKVLAKKNEKNFTLRKMKNTEVDADSSSSGSFECESSSSSEEGAQCGTELPQPFSLSCLRNWSKEKLEECCQNYTVRQQSKKTDSNIGIPKLSKIEDFTPWWDEFVKPSKKSIVKSGVGAAKDADSFNNWFEKTHSQSNSSSWLSGPGPSKVSGDKSSQPPDPVEEIEVPSIYNQKPKIKGRRALKRERKAEREKTLGKKWFEMRAPDVDDNTRMDMEMIRMRGILDPKRFYKHNDRRAMPKYFQMGTVVDEGTDFYSSRLTKKQRKQTLVEELMADANIRQYNKRKYSEVQQKMRNKKFKGKKSAAS